jgi:hypothetical protein
MTRVYLSASAGLRPNQLAFKDLDVYVAAWRDALVRELRAYTDNMCACLGDILIRWRRRAEVRLRVREGPSPVYHKPRTLRAWRRNAKRLMARHYPF